MKEIKQYEKKELISKKNTLKLFDNTEHSVAMEQMDQELLNMNIAEREDYTKWVMRKIMRDYPVTHDTTNYQKAMIRKGITLKEDFNLKNEGKLSKHGNMQIGGISPDYRSRVDKQADFRHWKRFWDLYNQYQEDDSFPDFDFHVPYIRKYVFNVISPFDAIKYLGLLYYKLMRKAEDEKNYPEAMIKMVEKRIKQFIEKLNMIIDTVGEKDGQQNSESSDNDNSRLGT